MKFKTLIAVAVAGAFAVPFAALAQGAGGTTTAPSVTHPQGNPPAGSPAGAQTSGSGSTSGSTSGGASWSTLDKNNDGYLSRDELKDDTAMTDRYSGLDKDNDGRISREEFSAHGAGAGATGSTNSGSSGSMMGLPKSPSSGGPNSGTGSKNSSTDPKGH